jgi:hypothetical protein
VPASLRSPERNFAGRAVGMKDPPHQIASAALPPE